MAPRSLRPRNVVEQKKMDAQTIRRALSDFFRFNPKDFFIQGSPTGFLVSLRAHAAAAASVVRGFTCSNASDEDGIKIRVSYSTLDGLAPDDGDADGWILEDVSDGDKIYLELQISSSDGSTTGRPAPAFASSVPPNTVTSKYAELAIVSVAGDIATPVNAGYGPVAISRCRNFAVEEADDDSWFVSFMFVGVT